MALIGNLLSVFLNYGMKLKRNTLQMTLLGLNGFYFLVIGQSASVSTATRKYIGDPSASLTAAQFTSATK